MPDRRLHRLQFDNHLMGRGIHVPENSINRFNDLGFHGPPTPAGHGPCRFDKGRSLVVE